MGNTTQVHRATTIPIGGTVGRIRCRQLRTVGARSLPMSEHLRAGSKTLRFSSKPENERKRNMAVDDFMPIQDDAVWFSHVAETRHAEVDFLVPAALNVEDRTILYYTVANKVHYVYDVIVNGQVLVEQAEVGPDGEHKVLHTIPSGVLAHGPNSLEIVVHSQGAVHFTDISAWIRGRAGAAAGQVAISQSGVAFEIETATTTRLLPFVLPKAVGLSADAALEWTIRQEQPRLAYTMVVNHPPPRGVWCAIASSRGLRPSRDRERLPLPSRQEPTSC